jgi:glutamyl-tRNA synthetase
MRATADDALWTAFIAFLPHTEEGRALAAKLDATLEAKIRAALPGLKERAKTLVELLDGARFIHAARPLEMEEKAATLLDAAGLAVLTALAPRLAAIAAADWSAASTEAEVRAYAEETGLKLGKAAQPLRAALTGRTTSPGIFDVLAVLGRDETLARLADRLPT